MPVTTGSRGIDSNPEGGEALGSPTRPHLFLIAVIVLAAASACAQANVGYDFDPQADFTAYRIYDWLAESQEITGDRRVDNAGTDIRMRTAIGAQLNQKGYKMALQGPPDFYVTYSLGLHDGTPDVSSRYLSDGMAGHAFSHSVDSRSVDGPRDTAPRPEANIGGSLLIDIIEATSHRLVWRGTADGKVDPGLTAAERNERVRAIVRDILANFPPQ